LRLKAIKAEDDVDEGGGSSSSPKGTGVISSIRVDSGAAEASFLFRRSREAVSEHPHP
jgi:hypothetical protein